MAAIAYPQHFKTAVVGPANTKYAYVHIPPQTKDKPYFFFLHGFPCTSYDWRNQIDYFSSKGYGIIAPDMLGCGSTEQPEDYKEYRLKKMEEEAVGILDAEGAEKVIGVGHDWGCPTLSRIANYHPERLIAYVFLAASYISPKTPFDIDGVNAMSKEQMGVPVMEYWHFFNRDNEPEELLTKDVSFSFILARFYFRKPRCLWVPSAVVTSLTPMGSFHITQANPTNGPFTKQIESTLTLQFCDLPGHWPTHFSPISGIKPYLENSTKRPLPDWITPSAVSTYKSIVSSSGYKGGLNLYRQHLRGASSKEEEEIPEENCHVSKPVLVVPCTMEEIVAPGMVEGMARPWCKDLRVRELECRHWPMLAKPEECNRYLEEFAEEVTAKA
ncbi:MAG: hypothetical protein M1831_007391 [Alyxoria varia]|nr:MAG: hypothetical protein M1831_007391 [Alyxoria varia]